ncbi:hypothetical protein [Streptomyces sp. NPDC003327]
MRRAATVVGAGAALTLALVAFGTAGRSGTAGTRRTGQKPVTAHGAGGPAGTETGSGTDTETGAGGVTGRPRGRRVEALAPAGPRAMPDFLGSDLWRVFTRLDRRTRLAVHDVGGRDRRVLWPPSWQVCTQYPAPGTAVDRRATVTIGVVRKGESCPPRVRTARR